MRQGGRKPSRLRTGENKTQRILSNFCCSKRRGLRETFLMTNRCVVNVDEPFRIITASETLLGHMCNAIVGRSILVLCGPWTDSLLFFSAISEASVFKSKSIEIFIRDRTGRKQLCKVICSPSLDISNQLEGCLLIFEIQDEICAPIPRTSVITTSANEQQPDGFTETQTTDSPYTLHLFRRYSKARKGPKTDSCNTIAISRLVLASPAESISVRPRQKPGRFDGRRPPVRISLDTVRALEHLPLVEAARAVGLSVTALSRACRLLGVDRWRARRAPGISPRHGLSPTC